MRNPKSLLLGAVITISLLASFTDNKSRVYTMNNSNLKRK